MSASAYLPVFYHFIVCAEKFQPGCAVGMEKGETIDLFGELNTLEVIKFGFVGLELGEVPVVEVARALELDVVENNDASALVANSKVLPFAIEGYR